jgi:hypothetical protein
MLYPTSTLNFTLSFIDLVHTVNLHFECLLICAALVSCRMWPKSEINALFEDVFFQDPCLMWPESEINALSEDIFFKVPCPVWPKSEINALFENVFFQPFYCA